MADIWSDLIMEISYQIMNNIHLAYFRWQCTADHTFRIPPYRLIECLKDPKTWLWFFYAAFSYVIVLPLYSTPLTPRI